jgi:bifunctional DNA-binding transcriptional regulator/antitoxin component of YhaV-PrlF toxin-antitoxin module
MTMSTLVGTKGQVTIEKEIRDVLGVKPGWRAIQRLEGDQVLIQFRPPKHRRSLYGVLADKAKVSFPTAEDLEAAVDQAWTCAAREAEGEEAPP